mmetsp:Transcript_29523/g.72840  ORF Transcript_29523/g.72840 Transcript_29523/m.72840 type:complete len:225 (+) Transcript_29523:412-1086(+)
MLSLPNNAGEASKPFLVKGKKDSIVGTFLASPKPGTSISEKDFLASDPESIEYIPAWEMGCHRRAAQASDTAAWREPNLSRCPSARGPRAPKTVIPAGSAAKAVGAGRQKSEGTPEKPMVASAGAAPFLGAAFLGAGAAALGAGAAALASTLMASSMPHCSLLTFRAFFLAMFSGSLEGGAAWAILREVTASARPGLLRATGVGAKASATAAPSSTRAAVLTMF